MTSVVRVYHYCDAVSLSGILRDGCIRTNVEDREPDSAMSNYVWFSASPVWEATCHAVTRLEPEDLRMWDPEMKGFVPQDAVRLVYPRFLVRPWVDVLIEAGFDELGIFYLGMTGIEVGSDPMDWFVRVGPMPLSWAIGLQLYTYDRWMNVTPEVAVKRLEYRIQA